MGEEVRKEKSGFSQFISGAFIGALVGSVTALLFAPKSGRELRSELNDQFSLVLDKTEQWKDTVVQKSNDFKALTIDATAKMKNSIKEQSTDLMDKIQNLSKKSEENIVETLEDAKETIAKLGEEIDRKLEELKR